LPSKALGWQCEITGPIGSNLSQVDLLAIGLLREIPFSNARSRYVILMIISALIKQARFQ
jgi:hypothetical protein